jgi:hypothetical protein
MELVGSEKAIQNAKTILEFFRNKIQVSSICTIVSSKPNRDLFSPDAQGLK